MLLRIASIVMLSCWHISFAISAARCDNTPSATDPALSASPTPFDDKDADHDGKMSQAEYLTGHDGDLKISERDFKLLDTDSDGFITPEQFAPIANGWDGPQRGPMPDPHRQMVSQICASLDKAFGKWDTRPNETVNSNVFISTFVSRLPLISNNNQQEGYQRFSMADANGDGMMSRSEARRLVEILIGVQLQNGYIIRKENCQVLNHLYFFSLDQNKDDFVSLEELRTVTWRGNDIDNDFTQADGDHDNRLTFVEWRNIPWTHNDPVYEFRQFDTDLDAFLSPAELTAGTPDWKKPLDQQIFPPFDINKDGKLSLEEYLASPHATMIVSWQNRQNDANGDEKLSFEEFHPEGIFPLLRMIYFRRYDANKDAFLDLTEYSFKTQQPKEMYIINTDGTNLKKIEIPAAYKTVGSPSISPDGKWLAYDCGKDYTGNTADYQLVVQPLEGGEAKEVCLAMMPTWSPDGLKVATSRNQPKYGCWIIDLTGEDHQYLGPGWGAQWSPDGKRIMMTENNRIKLYDVEQDTTNIGLAGDEHSYQGFYWNGCWSPDSKRVCIEATHNDGGACIAIIDFDETGKNKARTRFTPPGGSGLAQDIAWHPNGKQIVFTYFSPERKKMQMYLMSPDGDEEPVLFPGQHPDANCDSPTFTPDGLRMVYTINRN
jgi:TolB protein